MLQEAINDSRLKAELLAESMGIKIIGIDSANLSDDDDVYDVTMDLNERNMLRYMEMCECAPPGSAYGLSDRLKSNTVTLNQEVRIVWLAE